MSLDLVITAEDRERGRTRLIDEAMKQARAECFALLVEDEGITLRITVTTAPREVRREHFPPGYVD